MIFKCIKCGTLHRKVSYSDPINNCNCIKCGNNNFNKLNNISDAKLPPMLDYLLEKEIELLLEAYANWILEGHRTQKEQAKAIVDYSLQFVRMNKHEVKNNLEKIF